MSEKDSFWDISSLLPHGKKRTSLTASKPVEMADVTIPAQFSEDRREGTSGRLPISRMVAQRESLLSYVPSWNPLLHEVSVSRERSSYGLYGLFREDALKYLSEEGSEAPYVPFFSYIPQYSQLNAAQKKYYFYFRACLNRGEYIQANQSYLFLYVYEIINLPDHIDPSVGVLRIANAWAAYRETIAGIDKYMTAWLSDYALIHGVSCPFSILSPFLTQILPLSNLKEFYLGNAQTADDCRIDAILTLASEYDYKKGRYASGEHGSYFMEHIRAAAALSIDVILHREASIRHFQTVKKEYTAFVGALLSDGCRYTLSVSYCSVSGTEVLRSVLTSVVKYAENKVRASLSIKSRLSVPGIPEDLKALIDAYFERALPPRARRQQTSPRPLYEEMYDAPSVGLSESEAFDIESKSWSNTLRLVPEEEREELLAGENAEASFSAPSSKTDGELSMEEISLLSLLYREDTVALCAFRQRVGALLPSVVERLNEYFFDLIGDVVLEGDADTLSLIGDYKTEVEDLLRSYKML